MSDGRQTITVTLVQRRDDPFGVDFGAGFPVLVVDDRRPLSDGAGPTPVQRMAAAVGNCLDASLTFALHKFKEQPGPLHGEVGVEAGRNPQGRLRALSMQARLRLGNPAESQLSRALGQFMDFCTVTQSVREAIPVAVQVFDSHGVQLQ